MKHNYPMVNARHLMLASLLATTALQGTAVAQNSFESSRIDFRDESIYFMITTRFYDGDPHNNVLCWDNQEAQVQTGDPCWRGDFAGVIDKLDYIKALGFTAIWITPIVQNASGYDYHGYHAMDFSHVDLRYESHKGTGKYGGSDKDVNFQTLIDAAHAKGIKIILDIVLNHTGNFGEETLCKEFDRSQNIMNQADINACMLPTDALPSTYLDSEKTQYAQRLALMKNTDGVNHDSNNYWHHVANGWNWDLPNRWWGQIAGDCVDLNTENPAVAEYLVKCYGTFIAMGVDGFRIDTSGHIGRLSFNSYYIPQFKALAEKYKAKRLGQAPFFMYGEVCARFGGVKYRDQSNLSPYFYTWSSSTSDITSWQKVTAADWANEVVPEGAAPLLNMVACENEPSVDLESQNTFMVNGAYHTPDYSQSSGFNVIDFPVHYNFTSAASAYGMAAGGDKYYNDATYNVVYVDSHDYGPQPSDGVRFDGSDAQWAENLSLMFTFRGIPCLYYGSEIGFRRGATIDNGPNGPLSKTGRAYFGGYITGDVTATDFGTYTASGNVAATLSHDLSQHLIRLNKIRQACPALRRGQWTSDGCTANGGIAFKRATADSYALVCLNGGATFTGCPSGTYTDLVTGQQYSGSTITVTAPTNQGQVRVLVKDYTGKSGAALLGGDGKFIYASASVSCASTAYDGNQEAGTEYYITKADAIGEPKVDFACTATEFTTESLEVTAYLSECQSGWFTINGGAQQTIASTGTTFTLGTGDQEGSTYQIHWEAVSNDGESKTGDVTFKKLGVYTPSVTESEVSLFLETSAKAVSIWVWNDTVNYTGGVWSSKPQMEFVGLTAEGRNVFKWTYSGTETTSPTSVIFLPDGTQSADITYVNHGYYIDNVYDHLVGATGGETVEPVEPINPDEPVVPIVPDDSVALSTTDLKENIQEGVILHCFDWTAAQVEAELTNIAAAGFTAVQLSPVHQREGASAWYMAYQPYDFYVGNSIASVASLTSLCTAAHQLGVKVIVDVIANHTNGNLQYVADRLKDASLYHNDASTLNEINYGSRSSIINDDMGIQDLDTNNKTVQGYIKTYIAELKSCGVDGIRFDAAKHIGLPSEGDSFWQNVPDQTMYNYGEILDSTGGDDTKLFAEYQTYISITDNTYGNGLANSFNSGNVPSSIGAFNQRGAATSKLVYWGESHDTYSNDNGESKYKSQNVIDRAYAIAAGNNGATALYFSRPFETDKHSIKMAVKGSTHFTAPEVAEVNHCHNLCAGEPNYYVHTDKVGAQVRQSGCIMAVGNGQAQDVSFANGDGKGGWLAAGTYTDRVGGGTFTVTAATISGHVGSTGIAVIYDGTVVPTPTPTPTPTPVYEPTVTAGEISCFYEGNAEAVSIWVWDATNSTNYTGGDWATKPNMTLMGVNESGTNIFKWTYDGSLTAVPEKVIFVADGSQSADLNFTNHGYYINNKVDHVVEAAEQPDIPYSQQILTLRNLVSTATTTYTNSVEGTAVGQYEAGSRATLYNVIQDVNGQISDDMELTVIEQLTRRINTAVELFETKKVTQIQVVDTDLTQYADVIYAQSFEARPGAEILLPVVLKNSDFVVSAFQTDIFLPNGFTIVQKADQSYDVTLNEERIAAKEVQTFGSNIISSGAIRLLFGAKSGKAISGNDGTIATIRVKVASDVQPGSYAMMVKKTTLNHTAADGITVEEKKVSDVITTHATISEYVSGDLNNDNEVDFVDLTLIEGYILEYEISEFNLEAADLNGDLEINVTDWTILCNTILNAPSTQKSAQQRQSSVGRVSLFLADVEVSRGGETEVALCLTNQSDLVASYQVDLALPQGITLTAARTAAQRCTDQQVLYNQLSNGSTRLLVTSQSDAPLQGTQGTVLYLTLTADAAVTEGRYALPLFNGCLTQSGSALRADASLSTLTVAAPAGIESLSYEAETTEAIYDLQGMRQTEMGRGFQIIRNANGTTRKIQIK